MKHSILRVNCLPNLFKHCSKILLLHINLEDQGIQEDNDFVQSYLAYIREQMYSSIEAEHISALASKVNSHGETFVVFKTNLNKKLMLDALHALFAELSIYCEGKVTSSYQYMEACIYMDGKATSFFRTNKIGDEVQDSNGYQKICMYDGLSKPRGKHLITMEEYRKIYKHSLIPPKTSIPAQKKNEPTPSSTTECEYYI